jgi:hypothetical protein
MPFTASELTEIDQFFDFMCDGEESTLFALRVQERLASPFIPPFDYYPEQNVEVPHKPKPTKYLSKYANAKTQKFTGKSIRRAASDNSISQRGIPSPSKEALQSHIHYKMLRARCKQQLQTKNTHKAIKNARICKYDWAPLSFGGCEIYT